MKKRGELPLPRALERKVIGELAKQRKPKSNKIVLDFTPGAVWQVGNGTEWKLDIPAEWSLPYDEWITEWETKQPKVELKVEPKVQKSEVDEWLEKYNG